VGSTIARTPDMKQGLIDITARIPRIAMRGGEEDGRGRHALCPRSGPHAKRHEQYTWSDHRASGHQKICDICFVLCMKIFVHFYEQQMFQILCYNHLVVILLAIRSSD
jgi:hypothetical protein